VLTGDAPPEAAFALIAQAFLRGLGVRVKSVEPAREAPGLEALPYESLINLTPQRRPRDEARWLVWWEEPASDGE
jgi:hypothetical protein